jgi:NTE family protein
MDVEALRTPGRNELFVNAVNVHTGCIRVFGAGDISIDAVLASACAPLMFQAAQIEGESYWDGSYGSNPALWPLYETSLKVDILMVELTPLRRAETPTTAKTILNRINEIASINGLVAELRSLNAINRNAVHADIRMHVVSLPDAGSSIAMEPSIKRAVGPLLFESLRRRGYAAGEAWLAANREAIGVASSIDIEDRYLAGHVRQISLPVDVEGQAITQDQLRLSRSTCEYTTFRSRPAKPTSVTPASCAARMAMAVGAESAASIPMPAAAALLTIS